jgi:GDP-L-fucose synthase
MLQSIAGSICIDRDGAARRGGIRENDTRPGDFLYNNLAIAINVIEASRRTGVAKPLFLGSSCIYPRFAPQPMPE